MPLQFKPNLILDPTYRCAALTLPRDALAVLPFTSSSDLDLLDEADELYGDAKVSAGSNGRLEHDRIDRSMVPYTPSFVLPLNEVDAGIRNVRDIAFLPNFQKPTVAVLCESERQTWTSSLMVHRDTVHLFVFTLDLSSTAHPVHLVLRAVPECELYYSSILPCCSDLTLLHAF